MDRIETYRNLIKEILTEYHEWVSNSANLEQESCLIFDETHDQYFCGCLWDGKAKRKLEIFKYIFASKNNKFYIEEDWTEEGIANELLQKGVSKEDIVLAFHDPETRKMTEFAVA